METTMLTILSQIVVGLVIAGVTALVTVRLALKRFRTEQLWTRKADVYSSILDALHYAKRQADILRSEYEGVRYSPKYHKDTAQKGYDAFRKINKAVDIGSFLLCTEANEALKKLHENWKKAEANASEAPTYYDHACESFEYIDTCLNELTAAAKKGSSGISVRRG